MCNDTKKHVITLDLVGKRELEKCSSLVPKKVASLFVIADSCSAVTTPALTDSTKGQFTCLHILGKFSCFLVSQLLIYSG